MVDVSEAFPISLRNEIGDQRVHVCTIFPVFIQWEND